MQIVFFFFFNSLCWLCGWGKLTKHLIIVRQELSHRDEMMKIFYLYYQKAPRREEKRVKTQYAIYLGIYTEEFHCEFAFFPIFPKIFHKISYIFSSFQGTSYTKIFPFLLSCYSFIFMLNAAKSGKRKKKELEFIQSYLDDYLTHFEICRYLFLKNEEMPSFFSFSSEIGTYYKKYFYF